MQLIKPLRRFNKIQNNERSLYADIFWRTWAGDNIIDEYSDELMQHEIQREKKKAQ